MREKRLLYKILPVLFLLPLIYIQAAEYRKAEKKEKIEQNEWMNSELEFLKSQNREFKQGGEVVAKIEHILVKFAGKLNHDPAEIAQLIYTKSREYRIDPLLVLGIIKTESGFSRYAVSNKGARGLMQLMETTGKQLAKEMKLNYSRQILDDGKTNITLGIRYMAKLLDRFDSLSDALEAYNRGPANMRRVIRDRKKINPKYSKAVIKNYKGFTNEYLSM